MSPVSRNLLLRLQVKRSVLLRHYDDEALHQLRVALRRLRSLLRHVDTDEAQSLRHDLGELAGVTNAARDWDALVSRARDTLKSRDFRRVQPWLQESRLASHLPVLDMLRSGEWSDAVRRLEAIVERGVLSPTGDGLPGEAIARGKHEVQRAWERVQSEGDRKHWHKLRIAIKELRYTFDSLPRTAQTRPILKTLKHCKRIQEMLGTWHDTAVQLQMVREFADGLDPEVEAEVHQLLSNWCKRLERESADALDDAGEFLAGKGSDLLH